MATQRIQGERTEFHEGTRIILIGWPRIFIDVVMFTTGDFCGRWFLLFEGYSPEGYTDRVMGQLSADRDQVNMKQDEGLAFIAEETLGLAQGHVNKLQAAKWDETKHPLALNPPTWTTTTRWQDEVRRLALRGMKKDVMQRMADESLSKGLLEAFNIAKYIEPMTVRDVPYR